MKHSLMQMQQKFLAVMEEKEDAVEVRAALYSGSDLYRDSMLVLTFTAWLKNYGFVLIDIVLTHTGAAYNVGEYKPADDRETYYFDIYKNGKGRGNVKIAQWYSEAVDELSALENAIKATLELVYKEK